MRISKKAKYILSTISGLITGGIVFRVSSDYIDLGEATLLSASAGSVTSYGTLVAIDHYNNTEFDSEAVRSWMNEVEEMMVYLTLCPTFTLMSKEQKRIVLMYADAILAELGASYNQDSFYLEYSVPKDLNSNQILLVCSRLDTYISRVAGRSYSEYKHDRESIIDL